MSPHSTVCLVALALFPPAAAAQTPEGAGDCYARAGTQLELNQCAALEFEAADQELNTVYQSVIQKHEANEAFLEKLRVAQRAWIAFRDAELEAMFPHKDEPRYYGSVFPLCWHNYLAKVTEERTRKLRRWIEGVEEGDVCAGSLPVKNASGEQAQPGQRQRPVPSTDVP
jgi:uncharacterized protein YecT (DUF1311 family)